MKKTLKLFVTMVALLMMLVGMFPNVALAATNVGVTLNTAKNIITSTNAVVYATINNPQAKKITDAGIVIVDQKSGNTVKTFTEKCNPAYVTAKSVPMWYDLNKELKLTLNPWTKYNYTMFAVIGGQKYTASGSFETPKTPPPITPIKNSKISSAYGDRNGQFHSGVDLIGSTTVMAVMNGKVLVVGWCDVGGNYIAILHDDGKVSCYFHLASTSVSKGNTVTQGQTIGVMGETGSGARGVHLHFEIRTRWQGSIYGDGSWRNDCINPTSYISGLD